MDLQWWCRPVLSQGVLSFYLDALQGFTSYSGALLQDGMNIEQGSPLLTEQGTIVNQAFSYTAGATQNSRTQSTYTNEGAAGANGYLQANVVDVSAASIVTAQSYPTTTLSITALDVGSIFSELSIGAVVRVDLPYIGFINGSLGASCYARIQGMEYDDLTNKCKLIAVPYSYAPPANASLQGVLQ